MRFSMDRKLWRYSHILVLIINLEKYQLMAIQSQVLLASRINSLLLYQNWKRLTRIALKSSIGKLPRSTLKCIKSNHHVSTPLLHQLTRLIRARTRWISINSWKKELLLMFRVMSSHHPWNKRVPHQVISKLSFQLLIRTINQVSKQMKLRGSTPKSQRW